MCGQHMGRKDMPKEQAAATEHGEQSMAEDHGATVGKYEHARHEGQNGQDEDQVKQGKPAEQDQANKDMLHEQDIHDKLMQIAKDDSSLDPYEINFRPEFREGRGPEEPFVNEYGVVIGDHMYDSPDSPLNQWSKDTDPAIMSGDQWVHPFKDIGFHTAENRALFEQGVLPRGGIFMHPVHEAAYKTEPASKEPMDEDG